MCEHVDLVPPIVQEILGIWRLENQSKQICTLLCPMVHKVSTRDQRFYILEQETEIYLADNPA